MADGVDVDNGTLTDYKVATDDDGTAQHQLVKIEFGADGVFTMVDGSNPLPVTGDELQTNDAAFVSGPLAVVAGVRRDADTTPVSADGDVHPLVFEESGRLKVATFPGSVTATTDTITSNGDTVSLDVSRYSNLMLHCTGTFSTVNCIFEGSVNGGTNWFTVQAVRTSVNTIETTTGNLSAAPAYAWELSVNALTNFRLRATAYTSGTQTWTIVPGTYATEPIPAAQVSATQPVSGTVTATPSGIQLGVAEDAAISGNALRIGMRAHSLVPTAMSADNDFVSPWCDRSGAQVVIPQPRQTIITVTPTISAAVYASGDVMGAANTITSAALATGRAGQIVNATLVDKGKQSAALEVWIFAVSPTLVNADNGAFDITDANMLTALPVGVIDFAAANYKAAANSSICNGTVNGGAPLLPYNTSGSANLFCAFVSRGTPTPASTSDLVLYLTVNQF